MLIAITREISASMQECELTHLARTPIDLALARAQHRRYCEALAALGCRVLTLPEDPGLPDSVFVEDVAVVLDELAILTRPGAPSRRPEVDAVAQALAPYRRLVSIDPPGTLDGGDVLRVGKNVYIGLSERSNAEGIRQVRAALEPLGYQVTGAPVDGCLHLKSAVSQAGADTLLINRAWTDPAFFGEYRLLDVDPSELSAANGLLVGETLVYPEEYPATRRLLEESGVRVLPVPASEVAKAEGAVTCCSLVFEES